MKTPLFQSAPPPAEGTPSLAGPTFEAQKQAIIDKLKAENPEPSDVVIDDDPAPPVETPPPAPVVPAVETPPVETPPVQTEPPLTKQQIDEIMLERARAQGNVVMTPQELAQMVQAPMPQAPTDPLAGVPQIPMPPGSENWQYDDQVRYVANEITKQVVGTSVKQAVDAAIKQVHEQYAPIVQQVQAQKNEQILKSAAAAMAAEHGNPNAVAEVEDELRKLEREDPNLLMAYDTSPAVKRLVDMSVKQRVDAKSKVTTAADVTPVPASDAATQAPVQGTYQPTGLVDAKKFKGSKLGEMGIDLAEFEKKVKANLT